MGLTVVGALLLITGLSLVLVSEGLRLKSGHGGSAIVGVGAFVAGVGLVIGIALVIALTSGRLDRARTDRAPARERLSPLRTARGGPVQQRVPSSWHEPAEQIRRVPPSWHEPADQTRASSNDYADDGWNLAPHQGWNPGLAYAWAPREHDDWDGQGEGDWDPGGEDWNSSAHRTAWPQEELYGSGALWPGAVAPQQGYMAGPHGYPDDPAPGYPSGPQPVYAAGPESGPLAGPSRPHLGDADAGYLAAADAGYLTAAANAGPATGPASEGPQTAYPEAAAADFLDPGVAPRDDDTSPIPVIRDPGQPEPQPPASEPVQAPKPFSVWEPAPKPQLEGGQDETYRPAHAEPLADTEQKIEQIKDLYVTAEAIGEDALGKHFEELHQRQRSLIREFFEKAGLGAKDTPALLGDDSEQDGAPLPG